MFRLFNYYRLLGIVFLLSGLQLTFRTPDIAIIKYVGLFLMFVGCYDIITGKSMKMAAAIKTPMPKKDTPTVELKDENNYINKGSFMPSKKFIGQFLKANIFIGVITLAIAITFFMSSGFLAKKYFNYKEVKSDFNYSSALTSDIPANTISVKYNNCSKLLLNDKLRLVVNSLESSSKNSILNITIENNSTSDIQLFGTNKFELIDETGKHFKFRQEDSIGIYKSADKSTKSEYKLVFEPITTPSKSINFKGQFWRINGGVQDLPFNIDIK